MSSFSSSVLFLKSFSFWIFSLMSIQIFEELRRVTLCKVNKCTFIVFPWHGIMSCTSHACFDKSANTGLLLLTAIETLTLLRYLSVNLATWRFPPDNSTLSQFLPLLRASIMTELSVLLIFPRLLHTLTLTLTHAHSPCRLRMYHLSLFSAMNKFTWCRIWERAIDFRSPFESISQIGRTSHTRYASASL